MPSWLYIPSGRELSLENITKVRDEVRLPKITQKLLMGLKATTGITEKGLNCPSNYASNTRLLPGFIFHVIQKIIGTADPYTVVTLTRVATTGAKGPKPIASGLNKRSLWWSFFLSLVSRPLTRLRVRLDVRN